MISFLTPTRGRAESLKKGIDSLGLVDGESEALVWLDKDDPQYDRYIEIFENYPNVKLFIKDRIGYNRFHEMMNFLAEQASYDWMILWNDDSWMSNPQWYKIFKDSVRELHPADDPLVLNIWGQRIQINLFPVISRKYWEILGHFSQVTGCDDYTRIVSLSASVNIVHHVRGIRPEHRNRHSSDPLNDETSLEIAEQRKTLQDAWDPSKGANVEKTQAAIDKLNAYLRLANPDISFLVPTRKRAEHLKFSLDTLSLEESNSEALVWIDDDDPQLEDYKRLLGDNKRIKIFIKPRVGYTRFHEMMNFLASEAKGNWLYLWNDDSYMDNPEWYKTFNEYAALINPKEEVVVLNTWGQGAKNNSFPVISRKYYELLEHWAPIAHSNLHIEKIADYTKIQRSIFGIQPSHRNYGRDKKMGDLLDDTKKEVDELKNKDKWMGLHTASAREKRDIDVKKILQQTTKKHAGFIGLGSLGLPIALAMEARGNRLIACDTDPSVLEMLKTKKLTDDQENLQWMVNTTLIEPAETLEAVAHKTDLIFCAVPQAGLKDVVTEIVKLAEKLNKKINLVVISICEPGFYEREIKPVLSPNLNYIYSPFLGNQGTLVNDFYSNKSVVVANDNDDVQPLINFYKLTIGNQDVKLSDVSTAENTAASAIDQLTPEISFLVPTRDRAEHLKFSIESLELEKNNCEALVWIDDDDPRIEVYKKLFGDDERIKIFIKPRVGYKYFHDMLNFLAGEATGKWLFLWNDDSYMGNDGWFKTFSDGASSIDPDKMPFVFDIKTARITRGQFPVMSSKYFELLGHISQVPLCDLYIRRVADKAHIYKTLEGIDLRHRQGNMDPERDNVEDNVKKERDAHFSKSKYLGSISPAAYRKRDDDVAKLMDYLAKTGRAGEIVKPNISFLIPSRGRPQILKQSIDSLHLDKHRLEALVWLDSDDPKLDEYEKTFADYKCVKLCINKRVTYRKFHLMVNFLASLANGDWMFLWHDDVYMSEPGWYKTFQEYASLIDPKEEPVVFNHNEVSSNNTFFPIISRKYYEILGHIAPTAFSGWYVARLSANHRFQRPLFGLPIKHRDGDPETNPEAVQDDTRQEVEALKKKSRYLGFLSGGVSDRRNDDGVKINQSRINHDVGFIGLGKLGLPVALAMEARGNKVIGYDVNPAIKDYLAKFEVPYKEEGIETVLPWNRVELAENIKDLVGRTNIVFCAIQTPHDPRFEGHAPLVEERADFDYSYLKSAIAEISSAADELDKKINLVVISTCLPGTYMSEIKPLLSPNINYIYNPFFIAMGTVLNDFVKPEFILIGKDEGDIAPLSNFYKLTLGPVKQFVTDITTAEGIKVFYNTFITTKTVLGNMYGEFAHKLGMNVDDIYEAISLAKDRLVSPRYLKAGVGDGGGCHPRDNIALSHLAKVHNLSYNFFDHLMMAREKHMEWLGSLFKKEMEDLGLPGVILGKSFKPESNIQTGSPAILVANILEKDGVSFDHYEFDHPEELPKAVYLIATEHSNYAGLSYPKGSTVIDPFRFVPKMDGVKLVPIGGQ